MVQSKVYAFGYAHTGFLVSATEPGWYSTSMDTHDLCRGACLDPQDGVLAMEVPASAFLTMDGSFNEKHIAGLGCTDGSRGPC